MPTGKTPLTLEHRKILARLELFADLEPRELEDVAALTKPRLFEANHVVVRQGEPADAAFAVAHGRLKVSTTRDDGREVALGLMGRGDVFGELAILDGGTRSATVKAIEPTLLLVLERVGFHALLRRSPAFAYKMLCVVARRLRRLTERTEDSALDVSTRLCKRLVQYAAQYGQSQRDGSVHIALPLDQRALGELLGTTRESVNKSLRKLERQGIARWSDQQIVITNLEALRQAATLRGR